LIHPPEPITNLQILGFPTTADFTVAWNGMYANDYIFTINNTIVQPKSNTSKYNPSTNDLNSASFPINRGVVGRDITFSIIPINSLGIGIGKVIKITPLLNAPTQKPTAITNFKLSSSSTPSSIVVTWSGGIGATQFKFTLNNKSILPTTLTSESATFTSSTPLYTNTLSLSMIPSNIKGSANSITATPSAPSAPSKPSKPSTITSPPTTPIYTQPTISPSTSPSTIDPITNLTYTVDTTKQTYTVSWSGGTPKITNYYYLNNAVVTKTSSTNNSATFKFPPKTATTPQNFFIIQTDTNYSLASLSLNIIFPITPSTTTVTSTTPSTTTPSTTTEDKDSEDKDSEDKNTEDKDTEDKNRSNRTKSDIDNLVSKSDIKNITSILKNQQLSNPILIDNKDTVTELNKHYSNNNLKFNSSNKLVALTSTVDLDGKNTISSSIIPKTNGTNILLPVEIGESLSITFPNKSSVTITRGSGTKSEQISIDGVNFLQYGQTFEINGTPYKYTASGSPIVITPDNVVAPKIPESKLSPPSKPSSDNSSMWIIIISSIVGLAIIGGGVYYYFVYYKKSKNQKKGGLFNLGE